MELCVQQTHQLNGKVTPPSSKSQSIRAMILALLAKGESTIINPLDSDDMQDAIQACTQLGGHADLFEDKLIIKSHGLPVTCNTQKIHSGNSGITTRFIMPLIGLRENAQQPIILDCGEQMRARPIHSLVDALRHLGLTIQYLNEEGKLPLSIAGQLQGGNTEVDGLTSQYVSALLMALPCAPQDSHITVNNLHERPYMEMTLNWLKQQNIQFSHQHISNKDIFHIPGKQIYRPLHTVIAGDFSSASYLIAAAAMIPGHVELHGLDMHDPQGDKRLVDILQKMGAEIEITPHSVVIQGGSPLTGLTIDANDIPDLLPTLAVIGTYAQGKTHITNAAQARIKETDRIHSMTEGLTRLGAKVEDHADGMTVYHSKLRSASLTGYDDHRTVMALAIAGLLAEGRSTINDSEAINKTFPTFIRLMKSLGANME